MRVRTKVAVNDVQAMRCADVAYYERMVRQPLERQLEALGWVLGDDYTLGQTQDLYHCETVYWAEAEVPEEQNLRVVQTSTREVEA